MILAAKSLKEGEPLPPWYYGLAYWRVDRDEYVFLPMPFHLAARMTRRLRVFWDQRRARIPEEQACCQVAYATGYLRGRDVAMLEVNALLRAPEGRA